MKRIFYFLVFIFIFSACNGQGKKSINPTGTSPLLEDSVEGGNELRNPLQSERDNAKAAKEPIETEELEIIQNNFAGRYKKIENDEEDNTSACNCDCLEIAFNTNFELCLVPDKMYITVISKKTSDNTAAVFLLNPQKSKIWNRICPGMILTGTRPLPP